MMFETKELTTASLALISPIIALLKKHLLLHSKVVIYDAFGVIMNAS